MTTDEHVPAKRLSLSAIVEMLLTRSGGQRSAVTLTRNAAGETQIDVTVRAGDDDDVATALDAEVRAVEIYDRLCARFPANGTHDNAEIQLTRNAKGETQISVTGKTSAQGWRSLDEADAAVKTVYDQHRRKYPMESGLTAKPGSVT